VAPRSLLALLLVALATVASAAPALGTTVADDFGSGIDPARWAVMRSPDLPHYTVDATHGDVRFAKPVDSTRAGLQAVWLEYRYPVLGDFTAEIQYHDAYLARVAGSPGNSVRLTARWRGLEVSAVRANELDAIPVSRYAWVDPPAFAYGRVPAPSNSGTLRIRRTGLLVEVSESGTPLYSAIVTQDTLLAIAVQLVNAGTIDSTSVTFDDFALVADQILFSSPTLAVGPPPPGALAAGAWPNPASGRVTFTIELPAAGRLRARVLDVQGRLVAWVHDGEWPAGRHDVDWVPGAAGAAPAPAGLYLLVAECRGQRVLRRFVLAR
jgi:hypothetical protein